MNPYQNPFSPGAGSPPPELVGRDALQQKAKIALHRLASGRPAKSMILVGLRGVGKTVLLNRLQQIAEAERFQAIFIEAHENKPLPALLAPHLRQVLFSLDRQAGISEKVKKGMRVLGSFIGGLKAKATIHDIEFEIGVEAERGTADSGDLQADLPELFLAVGEAAADRRQAIAICIDELQYLSESEMGALIMALHRVSQRSLPLTLIGAGLPQVVGLAGRSKSYAERLFDYPEVGPLSPADAREALWGPIKQQGAGIDEEAIGEVIRVTEGYPYFLQQWGYEAWDLAPGPTIRFEDVREATTLAIAKLDESFFRVRFDRLTPREKDYLRAMAELGPGHQRSGEIAESVGVTVQTVAPARNSLVKKGMIYSPAHGDTAFTVPLFGSFLRRVMPGTQRRKSR